MERQGLGYEQLRRSSPTSSRCRSRCGATTGRWATRPATRHASPRLAGLASLVGYDGGPPLGANMRYGDSTVGAAAAFAAVAALMHRELTGEGQFVDVSAVETLSSMIGDCLLEQALTGASCCPTATTTPTWPRTAATRASGGRLDQHRGGRRTMAPAVSRARCRRAAPPSHHTATTARRRASTIGSRSSPGTTTPASSRSDLRSAGVPAAKSATAARRDQRPAALGPGASTDSSRDHREGQRPILGAPWRMSGVGPYRTGCARSRRAQPTTCVATSCALTRWRPT